MDYHAKKHPLLAIKLTVTVQKYSAEKFTLLVPHYLPRGKASYAPGARCLPEVVPDDEAILAGEYCRLFPLTFWGVR